MTVRKFMIDGDEYNVVTMERVENHCGVIEEEKKEKNS